MQLDKSKKVIVIGALVLVIALVVLTWYFYSRGVSNSEDVVKIEITNCSSIEPAFLSVQKDKPIYLVNRDSKEHVIKIAGNELSIGAGEEKILGAEFTYGAGTYAYDCNSTINAGQIQIVTPEQDLKGAEQTFKEMYDSLPKELRDCVKKMLSSNFEKVYNGQEGFVLGPKDQEAMNSCLESPQQTPQQ